LRWQLIRPSGGTVFSSFFANPQGRTVLPEAGQYRIRIYTDANSPTRFGTYSFSTRGDVLDQQFQIKVGDVVSEGKPTAGAGHLETPGSTDIYAFDGRAGQFVIFESLLQAPAFQGSLRWELIKPSGGTVFSTFFSNPQGRVRLPEAGLYKIRIFTGSVNPNWIGTYSFRTYSPVHAYPDSISTHPNEAIVVGFVKFLFNDTAEDPTDVLKIELPEATSSEGGAVTLLAGGIRYTPKAGFAGTDQFNYRLLGTFGGTNQTTVTIGVMADAWNFATMVNLVRIDLERADFCLLGEPSRTYAVETSLDLSSWQRTATLTADSGGGMVFHLEVTPGTSHSFFRARRN
jgi:hypothetical protein